MLLFKQAGVIRVDTLGEMIDVAALLSTQPLPKGKRVAVITYAGGIGVLLSDYLNDLGLELAELEESTKKSLRTFLPKEASVINPIDMIASATPDHYYMATKAVLGDENVDSLIAVFIPPMLIEPERVEEAIVQAISETGKSKPVLLVIRTSKGLTGVTKIGEIELPTYPFPEQAAKALYHAVAYSDWLKKPSGKEIFVKGSKDEVAAVVSEALGRGSGWLSFPEILRILNAYSIPVAKTHFAKSAEEAGNLALEFKDEVALKALVKGILHKSEVGLVKLGIEPANVHSTAKEMEKEIANHGLVLEGFIVQEMVEGMEMLVGINYDEMFGSLVLLGFGGIYAEVFKDFSARFTPLTEEDLEEMLVSLKGYRMLTGYRGAKYDTESLKNIVRNIAQLAFDFPEIAELDLNPVIVQEEGAKVVDARIRVAKVKPPIPISAKRAYYNEFKII
ncbi:MAG TPA: acetate--CoA ligase family protein [Geobacterales bacterium]|nr:acetate--CoA ligase family protein [Geobacterales bacterium]